VAKRVRRTLLRRRAPPEIIDDALQEAALRAWSRAEGFDDQEGMVRWVTVVAWHQVIAEWRRQARVEPGAIPERPASDDPAKTVEDRLGLEVVIEGLAQLNDVERAVILSVAADGAASDSADRARTKMRRLRARQHLAVVVGRADSGAWDGDRTGP
jgi:DNA-directed RNA polymerase specialized sigma24 family protein